MTEEAKILVPENVPRPFPIHRSIATILDLIGVQTESRHISLVRNLDPRIDHVGLDSQEEGLWVVGSELRLQQVITNLATNAVKYTPEGAGPVTVATHFLDKTPEYDDGQPVEPPDTDELGNVVEDDSKKKKEQGPPREVLTLRIEIHDSGPGSECLFYMVGLSLIVHFSQAFRLGRESAVPAFCPGWCTYSKSRKVS